MQINEKIIKEKKIHTPHKFQSVSVKLHISEGKFYTHYHTYSIIPTSTKSTVA